MRQSWRRTCAAWLAACLTLGGAQSAWASVGAPTTQGIPDTPAGWPLVLSVQSNANVLTRGVSQETDQFQTTAGPLQVNLLSVDLSDPNVKLGVVLANDRLYSPDETLTSMASRTGAVAGINGDFFELGKSGKPENLCIRDGLILQSPLKGRYAVVGVTADGHITIGPEQFSGTVTVMQVPNAAGSSGGPAASTGAPVTGGSGAGGTSDASAGLTPGASFPFVSINRPGSENGGQMGLITPALGSQVYVKSDTLVYLTPASLSSSSTPPPGTGSTSQAAAPGAPGLYRVQQIVAGAKVVPPLTGEVVLTASAGAAADWVGANLQPGDIVAIDEHLSPDDGLVQAVGAGYQVLKDGRWFDDPQALGAANVDVKNPLTAVGVSQDGKRAFLVVVDGREETHSVGLTYRQMASYLQHLGAWDAAVLDGGGSSEMVARLPGSGKVSVLNAPSDGWERRVANGLFVYSTEAAPAPANQVVVNGGSPLVMLTGTRLTVPCYALDEADNTAREPVQLAVQPANLAQVSGTEVTALRAGKGQLVARTSSGARAVIPLTVVDKPASVSIQPSALALQPGQTHAFQVHAYAAGGLPLAIPVASARWTVSNPALGTISDSGTLQANPMRGVVPNRLSGEVRVSIAGVSAAAQVSVGYVRRELDPLANLAGWSIGSHNAGRLTASPSVKVHPSDAGSVQLAYNFRPGGGVQQMVFWPKDVLTAGPGPDQGPPQALGLWVKGDGSGVQFAVSVTDAGGTRHTLYPFKVDFTGWRYVTIRLPSGTGPDVTINFLDILVQSPRTALKGTLYVSHLQALYRSVPVANSASPPNLPAWFRHVTSPSGFIGKGVTFAVVAGAFKAGSDGSGRSGGNGTGPLPPAPGPAGATGAARTTGAAGGAAKTAGGSAVAGNLWSTLAGDLRYRRQKGDQAVGIQVLGNIPGLPVPVASQGPVRAVLAAARVSAASVFLSFQKAAQSVGVPVHWAVGPADVAVGPENQGFRQAFGPTHYAYTSGPLQWIVLDDAHGGLAASDPYQYPAGNQLAWLAQKLAASKSKVVAIAASCPAYSPAYGDDTPLVAATEAFALEQFAAEFQEANPGRRVLLVFGGASRFAVRCIDANGQDDAAGVLNIFVPATRSSGILLHASADGQVQWAQRP